MWKLDDPSTVSAGKKPDTPPFSPGRSAARPLLKLERGKAVGGGG